MGGGTFTCKLACYECITFIEYSHFPSLTAFIHTFIFPSSVPSSVNPSIPPYSLPPPLHLFHTQGAYGWGEVVGICVDTHVHRIRYVPCKSPHLLSPLTFLAMLENALSLPLLPYLPVSLRPSAAIASDGPTPGTTKILRPKTLKKHASSSNPGCRGRIGRRYVNICGGGCRIAGFCLFTCMLVFYTLLGRSYKRPWSFK